MDHWTDHPEVKAATERQTNAYKALDKAKKAHDRADSKLATHDPKRLKAVQSHIDADKEVSDATAHLANMYDKHRPKLNEGNIMDKQEILKAILSKDATKLVEAKAAIKALLDARATQFRADSTKFIAKSLFESVDTHSEAESIVGEYGSKPARKGNSSHSHLNTNGTDEAHEHLTSAGFKHNVVSGSHAEYTKGKTKVTMKHAADHEQSDLHDVTIHTGD